MPYGNILKIIHEGIKNSIYNLVHYRNNNLLIYTVNTNIETSQLKIYDLNRNDNTASELNQLHKFNTKILLMIPLKSFLGMDILLTSTNQEIKKEESENKNINQKILNSGKSLGPNSKEAFSKLLAKQIEEKKKLAESKKKTTKLLKGCVKCSVANPE